ncbi:MAG: FHA domain-containing protein, partial [Planctomycetota bacterium]
MDSPNAHQAERFMLWVDAVGGFWVCLADEITLGQPVRAGLADVPILADISSRHARIRRDGEGYL